MRSEKYSCAYFHCFRDEAAMKVAKRYEALTKNLFDLKILWDVIWLERACNNNHNPELRDSTAVPSRHAGAGGAPKVVCPVSYYELGSSFPAVLPRLQTIA